MPIASGPNGRNGANGAGGANAASVAPAAADVPRYGEAQGRASARELGAFEAALRRQSQAPSSGGKGDVGIDGTNRAERKGPGDRAGEHGAVGRGVAEHGAVERGAAERGGAERGEAERVGAGRGMAERDAAERGTAARGAAEPRASRRDATEAGSADRGREQAFLQSGPTPSPLGRRGLDDEASATLLPETAAAPSTLMPPPLVAAVEPPRPAPRTLAAEAPLTTAARRATLAELAAAPSGLPQRWQVQVNEPAFPVRSLDIERAAAGPLTLVVSTTQPVSAHQADKLRRLLAARGAEPVLRGAADPQDEEFPR